MHAIDVVPFLQLRRVVYYQTTVSAMPIAGHLLAVTKLLSTVAIGSNSVAFEQHYHS